MLPSSGGRLKTARVVILASRLTSDVTKMNISSGGRHAHRFDAENRQIPLTNRRRGRKFTDFMAGQRFTASKLTTGAKKVGSARMQPVHNNTQMMTNECGPNFSLIYANEVRGMPTVQMCN